MEWLLVFIIVTGEVNITIEGGLYKTIEACEHDAITVLSDDHFSKKLTETKSTASFKCVPQKTNYLI